MSKPNDKNTNNLNNAKKLTLWERWCNINPRKRLILSASLLIISAVGLYVDNLNPKDNPFTTPYDRKDVTYRTIDYRKPAGQRVTVMRNGVIIEGGPDNIKPSQSETTKPTSNNTSADLTIKNENEN